MNKETEEAVVTLIANVFNAIAFMNPETVRHNMEMGSEGGFAKEYRTISKSLADYMLENFSIFFICLVVNKDYRETLIKSIDIEMTRDELGDDFVNGVLAKMDPCEFIWDFDNMVNSSDSCVIDFSKPYNDALYKEINGILADSFEKIEQYNPLMDVIIGNLSDDDLLDIGYIVSNFMYLIRAHICDMFTLSHTMHYLSTLKKQLEIK